MNLSCLHTHSSFCDGSGDVESFCHEAFEKGLHSLGFSAHAPILRKTGIASDWHLREERLGEYFEAVRAARARWEGRLRVYLGLEADYVQGLCGPADWDRDGLGLDYLIGSVHYLVPPRGEPFAVDGSPREFAGGVLRGYGGDGEAAAGAYWDAVEGMIRAGGFDILGHLDLVKKNLNKEDGSGPWFDREGPAYRERAARAVRLIRERSPGEFVTELNTGGLNRGKTTETYPSAPILRLLGEGPESPESARVILCADAHRPEDLDGHYGEALQLLRESAYRETLLFEGRFQGRPRWRKEPL
jgi:histidinol-phosphatase (PHP family)